MKGGGRLTSRRALHRSLKTQTLLTLANTTNHILHSTCPRLQAMAAARPETGVGRPGLSSRHGQCGAAGSGLAGPPARLPATHGAGAWPAPAPPGPWWPIGLVTDD